MHQIFCFFSIFVPFKRTNDSFAHLQTLSFCSKSVAACMHPRRWICFSSVLLLKHQKCRFCWCACSCCSQNQSFPRPSTSSTPDISACRPPPQHCIHTHARQPFVVRSNVHNTDEARQEIEALTRATHLQVVSICIDRETAVRFFALRTAKLRRFFSTHLMRFKWVLRHQLV